MLAEATTDSGDRAEQAGYCSRFQSRKNESIEALFLKLFRHMSVTRVLADSISELRPKCV
jgi:hypothetical protein